MSRVYRITATAALLLLSVCGSVKSQEADALYERNKSECLTAFGPTCYWYGCYGGNGETPEIITQSAFDQAVPIIASIVELNIEPWWSYWWAWTPPDNNTEYESLLPLQRMFDTCDIDGSAIVFPQVDDVSGSADLTDAARERIEIGLMNVRLNK